MRVPRSYFRTCARVASDRATYAHTFARMYAHSHIHTFARSFARMSFTHTFIPPFMSLVTTRAPDNKNIFTRLKKLTYTFEDVGDVEDVVI